MMIQKDLRTGEKIVGKDKRETDGHMALRNNVWEVRDQLWDELVPFEMRMIDVIIDKTIKWRVKEAKVTIEELIERTKKNRSWVYEALKSLEKKGVIIRRKIRHDLYIGLNEDYFGGLLIKRHDEALQARRKKIKVVVDNSKNRPPAVDSLSVANGHSVYPQRTLSPSPADSICTQVFEMIEEPRSLKTLLKDTSLKTSLKESASAQPGSGESFTLLGGRELKPKRTQEEQEKIIKEQLEIMKSEVAQKKRGMS